MYGIPQETRDISAMVLESHGREKVLPAAWWSMTTRAERALFGTRNGIYGFVTVELVDHLKDLIGNRKAIEIGSGNGVLADALGIQGTDNMMQNRVPYRQYYLANGQAPIVYGRRVARRDAHEAVERFTPDVVVAQWVTHKYDPTQPHRGGNEIGVDEAKIIERVGMYIFIGNDEVHKHKPIWDLPHTKVYPEFVYSRAMNGTKNFIAIWGG